MWSLRTLGRLHFARVCLHSTCSLKRERALECHKADAKINYLISTSGKTKGPRAQCNETPVIFVSVYDLSCHSCSVLVLVML